MTKADRAKAESLEAILAATAKAQPPPLELNNSARTASQWAAIWGVSRDKSGRVIRAAVQAGKMRAVRVVRMNIAGAMKTVPGYEVI